MKAPNPLIVLNTNPAFKSEGRCYKSFLVNNVLSVKLFKKTVQIEYKEENQASSWPIQGYYSTTLSAYRDYKRIVKILSNWHVFLEWRQRFMITHQKVPETVITNNGMGFEGEMND